MSTLERFRALLDCDPATGTFTWLVTRGGKAIAGSIAGSPNSRGYLRIRIDGRGYRAHRLVWLYVHGKWPAGEIDHINGVKDDNRLANLREATRAENNRNVGLSAANKTGVKGVCFVMDSGKYRSRCRLNGEMHHLGYHDTLEAAERMHLAFERLCAPADFIHESRKS